jgi:hypothetical protein
MRATSLMVSGSLELELSRKPTKIIAPMATSNSKYTKTIDHGNSQNPPNLTDEVIIPSQSSDAVTPRFIITIF